VNTRTRTRRASGINSRLIQLLILGWVTLGAFTPLFGATAPKGPVSIVVPISTMVAPANVFVQILIERNAENRSMRISIESAEYFSSSEMELDGERSARLRVMTFREVPAGEYELRGEVLGEHGRVRATTRAVVRVVGPN
jgi:hypothetical protein